MNALDLSDRYIAFATGGGKRGRRHGTRALCLLAGVAASLAASPTLRAESSEDLDEAGERQPVEELFQTGLVYPQERGEVQLALMPTYSRGGDGRTLSLGTEVEYGLTDAWQIGMEWDALVSHRPANGGSAMGIGDLELATQYSFMHLGGRPIHAALAFELGLPIGDVDRGLGEGAIEYTPSAAFGWQIPSLSDLNLVAQAGLNLVQRMRDGEGDGAKEPAAHEYFLSGGAILPVNRFAFSVEGTWRDNTWNHDGDEQALYLTPGVHWLPGDGWQLGAGVSFGLNRRADDYQLRFLLIREF